MKRWIAISLGLCLLTSLIACGLRAEALAKPPLPSTILLLTDRASDAAPGPTEALLEGVSLYAQVRSRQVQELDMYGMDAATRLQTLSDALATPPLAVVCLGASFEPLVFTAQSRYPDINFLLIDGEPRRSFDGVYETRSNTHAILFDESQLGFLAGYAAVREGGRSLGFCGVTTDPDVLRYGYGFIQGAEAAAVDLGLPNGSISLRYRYADAAFDAATEQARFAAWYAAGVQSVFVYDNETPAFTETAAKAAKEANANLITADIPHPEFESETLFCVAKDYRGAVYRALLSLEEANGRWDFTRAGCTLREGLDAGAVNLRGPSTAWPLTGLSPVEYRALCKQLLDGTRTLDPAINPERFPLAPHCSLVDEGG